MDGSWPEAEVASRGPALTAELPAPQFFLLQVLLREDLSVPLIHLVHPKSVSSCPGSPWRGWSLQLGSPEATRPSPLPRKTWLFLPCRLRHPRGAGPRGRGPGERRQRLDGGSSVLYSGHVLPGPREGQ